MNKLISNTARVDKVSVLGTDVRLYRLATVIDSQLYNSVSVGDEAIIRNSILSDGVEIGRRNTIDNSSIGKGTYTGEFCLIKFSTIGKFCSLSWNVSIGGANHQMERLSSAPLHRIFGGVKEEYLSFRDETVKIGNDVWIGSGVTVLRGVEIGDGAVIGAGSVVTKNVPPYAVVAGVPAKTLRYRFNSKIVNELLEIKWWDWPKEKIDRAAPYFKEPVTMVTISKLKEL